MGACFLYGQSGGGGINFKVVGGTTQPTGKENTVWVNTNTAISSWVVSPNEPTSPTAGMVWIKDGSSNGINIVKKNAVEVFPSSCSQYIDGAWKSMEAYLFRNNEWVQFSSVIMCLVKDGKLVAPYTVGTDDQLTIGSGYIQIYRPEIMTAAYFTLNFGDLDISAYKTLHFEKQATAECWLYHGAGTEWKYAASGASYVTVTTDVTAYSNIRLSLAQGASTTVKIKNLWFD